MPTKVGELKRAPTAAAVAKRSTPVNGVADGSASVAGPPTAYTVPGCAVRYVDTVLGNVDPLVSSTAPPRCAAAGPADSASGKLLPVASNTVPGLPIAPATRIAVA